MKEIIMETSDSGAALTSDEAVRGATGRIYEDWFHADGVSLRPPTRA